MDKFCWTTWEPFTRRQAIRRGMTDGGLRRLCADGHLRRPLRGVYVDALRPDTLALQAEVLRLVVPADGFAADGTAAWLHGADALAPNEHLDVPSVSVFRRPGRGRLRTELTASGERRVIPRDLTIRHGLAVTTPLRTALDLGRLQRRDVALAGMDAMANLGTVTSAGIRAEIPRFARMRGVVQLRSLAPLVDGLAQSPGESASRLRWLDAGLPRPTLQVPVRRPDGRYFYLDLGLPAHRFAAEYDGQAWHTSAPQPPGPGTARVATGRGRVDGAGVHAPRGLRPPDRHRPAGRGLAEAPPRAAVDRLGLDVHPGW